LVAASTLKASTSARVRQKIEPFLRVQALGPLADFGDGPVGRKAGVNDDCFVAHLISPLNVLHWRGPEGQDLAARSPHDDLITRHASF
jgi:hypothetical protein